LTVGGVPQQLVGSTSGVDNLASTPQTLGIVYAMGMLAPKTLVIATGTQVLKAVLP
jgi:hypothetical protein